MAAVKKIWALLMAFMICAVGADPQKNGTVNQRVTNFFVWSCNTTADPQSCASTLSDWSGWQHSGPSIGLLKRTLDTALGLFGVASRGLERSGLEDCIHLLNDAKDEFTEAPWHVLGLDTNITGFDGDDVRTYLSAALTSLDTCIEGLSLSTESGAVKSQLQSYVEEVSHRVSTSLAMAKRLSDDFKANSSTKRPLMDGDGFPKWVSAAERRLLEASPDDLQVDAVVAKDGTGHFPTITAAINATPEKRHRRYVIRVKAGVYRENIIISRKKENITLIGDGMNSTVVTGNISVMSGVTTFHSATFAVEGKGFIARDMGFENTAGPENNQAVALRVGAEKSVIYRCSIKGYQGTLYAHKLRQFYRECEIYGTVDFIFGNAAAVFQRCLIMARKPLQGQTITISAQGRKEHNENTGFSFQDCNITSSSGFVPVKESVPTYLGRPWKKYSRTVVMESYLGDLIHPSGWQVWNASNFALDTLYYGEYKNYGPGAAVAARVNWTGYHNMNRKQAKKFTVINL